MNSQHDADVIVVGAGTGGLTVAAYLAVAGRRVVVVDQGREPGGCGSVFTREGHEFDVGLHYIGSNRDGTPATESLLDPLGVAVAYNRLEPVDTIVLPDATFEVPTGLERYREHLHAALPDECDAVDRYLSLIDSVDSGLDGLRRLHGVTDLPATMWRSGVVVRHLRSTLGDVFDNLRLSPRARTLLGWINGVYAVPPSEASLLMHALVSMHYLHGAWYPQGGGAVISQQLADVVRANGGTFVMEHEVTRILVGPGGVQAVAAVGPDGNTVEIAAPVVVSDVDIKRTFLGLLDPDDVPVGVRRKVRGYEMSLPLGVLYGVVDRDLAAEGVPVTNFMVAPGDNLEETYRTVRRGQFPAEPTVWMTSSSLKDPGNPRLCPPGQTNLQLMTMVPPQDRAWGLEAGVERGEEYHTAKRRFREQMLAGADRAIPGLSEALVFDEVATPYTMRRYLGATDGTSYGIACTPDQMALGRPGVKTSIRGLFLAGASTRYGHGITGVMGGGIATASAVLGTSAVVAARAVRPATPRRVATPPAA
jgi:all-trans-retinol 13,14-reductase